MSDHLVFKNPEGISKPTGYTHVVEARDGRTIYISGQVALNGKGELVGQGDFEAQCIQVFENLKIALTAAGTDFNSVVKLTFFLKDMVNMPVAREVRNRYLNPAHPPASSAVEVKGLVSPDWLIEVEAIAVVGGMS
jgi:reactive intermediate/imine deaminase